MIGQANLYYMVPGCKVLSNFEPMRKITEVVVVGARVRLHQSESGWRYVVGLSHGEDALAGWMVGWDGWMVGWGVGSLGFTHLEWLHW